jgi:predicted alpha/beta-hydrolase family hydrolase
VETVTPYAADEIHGFLHWPEQTPSGGLVLAHGAGSDCTAPLLVATARAFAEAGVCVLRIDLPFRRLRPSGPPHPAGAARDREGLRRAAAALRERAPGRLFLGGHSYGGRQASMLAADEPGLADALLLLSYPLHPPRQPDKLRTDHFPRLNTPAVFVHGTIDPFATPQELEAATALIPAPTRLIVIERGGHDLKRGRVELGPVVSAMFEARRA